jgi:glutathione synthase
MRYSRSINPLIKSLLTLELASNKISEMHKYLNHIGAYQYLSSSPTDTSLVLAPSALPPNNTLSTLVSGLSAAHYAYGPPKSSIATRTCVLMIVQPNNFNIADERPIEYSLFSQDPPIPVFRVHFGVEVLKHTSLTPSRELLYHPPTRAGPAMEVSLVYFRAGFETHEYDEIGRDCRLHLERSRAIKCPSILSHLTTFKKVQQELVMPGVLEQFLSNEEASLVIGTFIPMYPMDESPSGMRARELAMDVKKASGCVLKPSLEGGGHNVYGTDIPGFLSAVDEMEWGSYVLMDQITPPNLENILMSTIGIHEGGVVSEFGVFGVCIWRRKEKLESDGIGRVALAEMVEELEPSWSFKTKDKNVNEMSVVKGYGCFDSPALVDADVFEAIVKVQGNQQEVE